MHTELTTPARQRERQIIKGRTREEEQVILRDLHALISEHIASLRAARKRLASLLERSA